MFDQNTFALAVVAVPIYLLILSFTDFWGALQLLTWIVPTSVLERKVRQLMMAQTLFRPMTGGYFHRAFWHLAVVMDALCRARSLETADPAARWRAVVLIGQAPVRSSALLEVERIADPDSTDCSARTAAAVLEERAIAVAAGARK